MQRVDYDTVAPEYDRRYEVNQFGGIDACLREFVGSVPGQAIAEIGCGTGHWLQLLSMPPAPRLLAGLDLSTAMLATAHRTAPAAALVRGSAEQLPWADCSFDRVFCVNALHHFPNPHSAIAECGRVLRPGGAFLTIGLDPHTSTDSWWVYDYFPAARAADRDRYPSAAVIRAALARAGFEDVTTRVAQHLTLSMSFETAVANGTVNRSSTSQLMVIPDADFSSGHARLMAERPLLHADLRLYATTGRKPAP